MIEKNDIKYLAIGNIVKKIQIVSVRKILFFKAQVFFKYIPSISNDVFSRNSHEIYDSEEDAQKACVNHVLNRDKVIKNGLKNLIEDLRK